MEFRVRYLNQDCGYEYWTIDAETLHASNKAEFKEMIQHIRNRRKELNDEWHEGIGEVGYCRIVEVNECRGLGKFIERYKNKFKK